MAHSLIDLFNNSEFKDQIKKNADKTPISVDGGKDLAGDHQYIDRVRGGEITRKKYSDSVNYDN